MRKPTARAAGWLAAGTCSLGLAFSLANMLIPKKALCLTSGCQILQSFSLFGIGLWPVSAAFFASCLILSRTKWAWRLLLLGICGDIALLALMLAAAPCAMCLIAGLLIAASFAFSSIASGRRFAAVLSAWSVLFAMQCGIAASDMLPRYVIYENGKGADIYFSPSCSFCADLMRSGRKGRWHPVAESDHDAAIIGRMAALMERAEAESPENPLAAAWRMAQAESFDNPLSAFLWKIRLWKNEARVLSGTGMLPYIESGGGIDPCPLKCPHCGHEGNAIDFSKALDSVPRGIDFSKALDGFGPQP